MDNEQVAQVEDVKTPGKIVSAGAPVRTEISFADTNQAIENSEGIVPDNSGEATNATVKTQEEINAENEQLKKLLADRGVDFDGDIESLKKKISTPAADSNKPEPTAEEKTAAEAALDKRLLEVFTNGGGKIEDFVALKNLANSDLRELSISEIKREMKAEGFEKDEIDAILKERYYQLNPEELEQGIDESDDEFATRKALTEKKIAYGSKKLDSKATHIKSKAAEIFDGLKAAIREQDLQKQEEVELSSKVDEHLQKLSRKITFELGEVNNQKIAPILYNVADAEIAEVSELLKDPAKRNQFLYNEDGSLNLTNLSDVILRNKILETALKVALIEGGDREVAKFNKIFPGVSPNDIGVGGNKSNTGRKGHLVSAGAPQPMSIKHQ